MMSRPADVWECRGSRRKGRNAERSGGLPLRMLGHIANSGMTVMRAVNGSMEGYLNKAGNLFKSWTGFSSFLFQGIGCPAERNTFYFKGGIVCQYLQERR